MAEVNTAEVEAKADAAFSAGFGVTPPAVEPPAKVVEEVQTDPAKPEAAAPTPIPEKTVYVRVTKQDWDNTKAATGKVASLESRLAKFEGSMPKTEQVVQQAIEAMRAQTPSGAKVTITPEDFAELGENFEEVSGMTIKGLQRVLDRFNVTGTSGGVDSDAIAKAVDARLKARDDAAVAATREKEMGGLQQAYPDWENIVGRPAPGTDKTSDTDWRKWATTNDKAALETDSPAEVQASIARFMESQKPAGTTAKPDKGAVRRAVIADAITPRADGGTPPIAKREDAEDAFSKAFKAVKRA